MACGEDTSAEIERAEAAVVVDPAYKVDRESGPGLLESVYVTRLAHELRKRGLTVEGEFAVPVIYDGITIDQGSGSTFSSTGWSSSKSRRPWRWTPPSKPGV